MLDLSTRAVNEWTPNELSEQFISICRREAIGAPNGYLAIFQTEPYIDSLFIKLRSSSKETDIVKRFVFRENYAWSYEDEIFFQQHCLKNEWLKYSCVSIEPIFQYYSKQYPEWHLKRYYTQSIRMLDHIYQCMRKGTAKEMLFKVGLDELAVNLDDIGEYDLLSTKPSEIYDGVSTRTLRALNCRYGSVLLSTASNREYIKTLQMKSPDMFKEKLNNAQCRYLMHLISEGLTTGETIRLFKSRYQTLRQMWTYSQYDLLLRREKNLEYKKEIEELDPIYRDAIIRDKMTPLAVSNLAYYVILNRAAFDRKIRRANRKRDKSWEERNARYVVRYPQTINDFCREAVYMKNCLMGYAEAFMDNDTTILFIRQSAAVNKPYITMEICDSDLMQAYHRFNKDCTREEADWIRAYCKRHGIACESFKFNRQKDRRNFNE